MGFYYSPSKMKFGNVNLTDFWVGTDSHSDKYIIRLNNQVIMVDYALRWTLTSQKTGDLGTDEGDCGGQPVFSNSNGWHIYYCVYKQKWILIQNPRYVGYIPQTSVIYDSYNDEYDYNGDVWWETSSLKTTPLKAAGSETGEVVGTFILGPPSYYPSLENEDTEIEFTGDLTNTYYRRTEGTAFPYGTYENGIYVGYPLWTADVNGEDHNIVKCSSEYSWVNLLRVNMHSVDGHYLYSRYIGWVCPSICGGFNGNTARGFYATPDKPEIGQDFILSWYHFVPEDPDDPESWGDIVQEDSYTDDEGVTHYHPKYTAVWQEILYTDPTNYVPLAETTTFANVAEIAIWR